MQVNHKYPERRMLVAEACGRLAGSVAAEMRPSLVLSILQQLATDASPAVRRTVVFSLSVLLPYLPDTSKYPMVSLFFNAGQHFGSFHPPPLFHPTPHTPHLPPDKCRDKHSALPPPTLAGIPW